MFILNGGRAALASVAFFSFSAVYPIKPDSLDAPLKAAIQM